MIIPTLNQFILELFSDIPDDPYHWSTDRFDQEFGISVIDKIVNVKNAFQGKFDRINAIIQRRSFLPSRELERIQLFARRHCGLISYHDFICSWIDNEILLVDEKNAKILKVIRTFFHEHDSFDLDLWAIISILDVIFEKTPTGAMSLMERFDSDDIIDGIREVLATAADSIKVVDGYLATIDYYQQLITLPEFNKRFHNAHDLPWWDMDIRYDSSTKEVEISFDYNELFVEELRKQGYFGATSGDVVDQYLVNWHKQSIRDAGYDSDE